MRISNFFGKKKTIEKQKVLIEDLETWLADRIKEELLDVFVQGDEVRSHIRDSVLSIKQTLVEVAGAEPKKSALVIAAERAADLPSTEFLAFEDIVELRERVTRDMTHLGVVWNGYRRTGQKGARSYTIRLRAQFKQIDGEVSRLNALISTRSPKVTALKRCQEQAKLLTARVNEVREIEPRLSALETNLESLESARANIEAQIERLKSTPEFESSLRLKGELSTLENRRKEITYRVHNGFSSLTRPLGKYGYAAGLGKDRTRLVDSFISETSKALSVADDSAIQEILSSLRKYVLQGRVETKNPEKTVSNIEDVMSELPKLGEEYRALSGRMETIQSQLNKTAEDDLERLEVKRREADEAIGRMKLESKEIMEERPRLNSEVDVMVATIERAVNENLGVSLGLGGPRSEH